VKVSVPVIFIRSVAGAIDSALTTGAGGGAGGAGGAGAGAGTGDGDVGLPLPPHAEIASIAISAAAGVHHARDRSFANARM
jgi:hypothetical protein